MSNATPRPWRYELSTTRPMAFIHADKDYWLADVHDGNGAYDVVANARLIVRAVNAHDELVSSLKVILEGFETGVFVRDITKDADSSWAVRLIPFLKALADAQRAIARAEAE